MPNSEEPTRRERRSLIMRTLLRALLTATLLLVLYYVAPMDHALDSRTVLLLIVCVVAFAALVAWRLREITQSEYPGLRAIETLAAVLPFYILVFATAYFLAGRSDSANFSQPMTRTGALYFSVTVFSTTGFGDITAKTDAARLVVTAQMLLDLILLGFGARAFVSAVKLGRQRHTPHQPE